MKLTRILTFLGISGVAVAALFFCSPTSLWRHGGELDLAMILDWSGSYRGLLPEAVASTQRIMESTLPGDRAAVVTLGPEVVTLHAGPVSPSVIEGIGRHLASMSPSTLGGSALDSALSKVAQSLEEFGRVPGKHRRVVVIFSDCQDEPRGEVVTRLPGSCSVVVIGFGGQQRDAVVRALQGADGTNDVHIVAAAESEAAVSALIESINHSTHPISKLRVLAGVSASLALGALGAFGLGRLTGRRSAALGIRLAPALDPTGGLEVSLCEGDAVTVGGGDDLFDLHLPIEEGCVRLQRSGGQLVASPIRGATQLQRQGTRYDLTDPVLVAFGDSLVLEGCEVVVQSA